MENTSEKRPELKYKVDQVVMLSSVKKDIPFRIVFVEWSDGWFYGFNSNIAVSESSIRSLRPDEIG